MNSIYTLGKILYLREGGRKEGKKGEGQKGDWGKMLKAII